MHCGRKLSGEAIRLDLHYGPELSRRDREIDAILTFVSEHPNSYASLAVCRRALDSGIERVDGSVVSALKEHLEHAGDDEIDAYYSIVM